MIAEVIKTIAFIISSMNQNNEKYMNDFKNFCEIFESLLYKLKEEDPEVIAILKAFSFISTSMRTNFYPFLEKLFPILSNYALADIDMKLEDIDIEKVVEPNSTSNTPGLILQSDGVNKKLSIKTFTLQNRVMAFEVLKDICLNMEKSFYPYVNKFLEIVRVNINISYSRKLRKLSARSFEASIYACENAQQQNQIFEAIFPAFLEKLNKDIEIKNLRDIKYTLKVFIHLFTEIKDTNVISSSFLEQLFVHFRNIVIFMEEKKQKIKETANQEDAYDENDAEGFIADIDVLNETNRRVMELSGIIYKLYRESISDLVNHNLTEVFFNILQKAISETKNEQEIVYGLCFFSDTLAYSKKEMFSKLAPEFMKICSSIQTKSEDIIQNIIFGYGIFVERSSPEEYIPYSEIISTTISGIITRKVTSENGEAFDNGIATLGKVLYFKTQNTDEGHQLAKKYLEMLPLKHDLDESRDSIKLLCNQFLSQNPLINNGQHTETIKNIFTKVEKLSEKEESVLDNEAKELISKVRQVLN